MKSSSGQGETPRTPLEQFATDVLGITLFLAQVEVIRAFAEGKTIVKIPRMGLTTANKVIREYIKAGVGSQPTHPKSKAKEG